MPELEHTTARPTGDAATDAAIADVIAAIGSDGEAVERVETEPASEAPVAASGATIGHGPIRLRDSAPPSSDDHPPIQQLVGAAGEPVGHGTIRLRGPAAAATAAPAPEAAREEPVGHGTVRLRDSDPAPVLPDLTPAARADILEAIAVTDS